MFVIGLSVCPLCVCYYPSVGPSVGWSVFFVIGRSVNPIVDLSIGRFLLYLSCRSVGRFIFCRQSVGRHGHRIYKALLEVLDDEATGGRVIIHERGTDTTVDDGLEAIIHIERNLESEQG